MAKNNNPSQEIEDFNQAGQEFVSVVTSMAEALKQNAKRIASETGEAQQKSVINTAKALSLAEKLKTFTKEQLADKDTLTRFENTLSTTKGIQAGIEAEIQELIQKQVSSAEDLSENEEKRLETLLRAKGEFQGIVGEAEKLKTQLQKIDEEVSFFDDLSEFTSQIPGLGKLFGEFENASKAARKAASEGKDAFAAGAVQFTSALGKLTLAFAGKKFVEGISTGQKRITEFSRQLNISRDQASDLNTRFVQLASTVTGITAKELAESTLAVSEQLGITADLTDKTAVAFATLTGKLGLSAEQAGNLTTFTAATGQNLEGFNKSLVGTVLQQNYATKSAVRYQDVMKDIATSGAATQLTISKFPGGVARAAYEARRLGLNMSQLEASASALLNFESSIESELEAELLTGKELTLERARLAALTGDQATLAAELAKNFGTAAEFSRQNVLAQEAQAKAMGMTRQELAETLMRQEAMKNLGGDMTKSLEENAKLELERINAIENADERKLARQKLFDNLGETELGRQLQNRSLAERQAEAMEKLADAVSVIAKPLDFIGKAFDGIGTTAGTIFGFITKIGSKLMTLGKLFSAHLLKPVEGFMKTWKFVGKLLTGEGLKVASKTGMKSLLKKIPILGLLVGAYYGVKRMMSGDILGGIMELGSGVLSLFPGLGTAASIATDVALAGLDAGGVTEKLSVKSMRKKGEQGSVAIDVDDFTIRTHPKDTLVMAGGTKLGDDSKKTSQLLERLIAAVEKGGNVYIDGNKVGQALVLSSYQSS